MKRSGMLILVLVLVASSQCWESECLLKILDDMSSKIQAQDISKANADVVASIKNPTTTKYREIYDNHLNYNTDFKDRVGEDVTNKVFSDAEASNELGFADVVFTEPVVVDNEATLQYYYIGACCYYFNPCVSLKLGYHLTFAVSETTKDLDPEVYKQSLISAKKAELIGVIKAKNDKNFTPDQTSTA